MEAEKKELLQVVGMSIPNPQYTDNTFGIHYATLEQGEFRSWKLSNVCGKELKFFSEGKDRLDHLHQDVIELRCACGFRTTFLRKGWNEALREWMRLGFGTLLRQAERNLGNYFHEIQVCRPKNGGTFYADDILYKKLAEITWGSRNHTEFDFVLWDNLGIVITRILNPPEEIYNFQIVNDGFLMTRIEELFQSAIKRSAELACSASELFHPDTRRNK